MLTLANLALRLWTCTSEHSELNQVRIEMSMQDQSPGSLINCVYRDLKKGCNPTYTRPNYRGRSCESEWFFSIDSRKRNGGMVLTSVFRRFPNFKMVERQVWALVNHIDSVVCKKRIQFCRLSMRFRLRPLNFSGKSTQLAYAANHAVQPSYSRHCRATRYRDLLLQTQWTPLRRSTRLQ